MFGYEIVIDWFYRRSRPLLGDIARLAHFKRLSLAGKMNGPQTASLFAVVYFKQRLVVQIPNQMDAFVVQATEHHTTIA